MTSAAETLLENALRLPLEERCRIATRLIESVDEEDDLDLSPEWQAEIDRRVESVRNGTAKLVPHEEVITSLKNKLSEQRGATSPP
ncbi:addiction module antitoxin RelB [Phragmitibacter flavus]|uniref:Addiction module antitoxin RelB n=1 Tax=Phragmitibacter flavus TaxID=2576071 RepID=A0A5R8KDK4_9BACT|nr:addiction module protein [Phragmitibacter flavus]TLD70327.1 addiction module antitoxin RelB [Phragmitibacter flavus]